MIHPLARYKPSRSIPCLIIVMVGMLISPGLPVKAWQSAPLLDPTFGTNGKATTDFVGTNSGGQAMAIQPDGRLVVAGGTNFFSDVAVVRYNLDGSLDASFGAGGKVVTAITNREGSADAVALQSDGKIVVAGGAACIGANCDPAKGFIVRYTINGTLDPTFNHGGEVTDDFGLGAAASVSAVAIQRDGKIIVGGYASSFAKGSDFVVARYNPDGSRDSTFGNGGRAYTDFSGQSDLAVALAIQPDGKIVAAGMSAGNGSPQVALARYNSNGSPDLTFGVSGKVTTSFAVADMAHGVKAMVLQNDGKIVVAVNEVNPGSDGSDGMFLLRYNPDGMLDSTFGIGGKTHPAFEDFRSVLAFAAALRQDGRIVVAGGFGGPDRNSALVTASADDGGSNGMFVAGFNTDGSRDSQHPIQRVSFAGSGLANAVAVQFDGRIVTAGVEESEGTDFAVARLLAGFDYCIMNDAAQTALMFDLNGNYLFIDCHKRLNLGGRGKLVINSCKLQLQDGGDPKLPDRNVSAQVNVCTKAGSATVQSNTLGKTYMLTDADATNGPCLCP